MTYPYDVVRRHSHWTFSTWHQLPPGEHGRWYEHLKVLLVDNRLGRIGRRVVTAHEVEHALHGDIPGATAELDARQELIRHRDAARKLIDVHHLADVAVAYPDDPHVIAELLDVDYDTLALRVRHLHPAERHYLRRRMASRDGEDVA